MEATTFVGLDVHKRMTSVAIAESGLAAAASRLVRSHCTTNTIASAAGESALTSGSPRTGGVSMMT